MPNWSSTSFSVRGTEAEIKILEGHLPCPKELSETTSTFALKEIPENWTKMVTDGEWTQEDYDKRVAENNELLKRQEENKAKFGANDWYDWQIQNWGVKWGDCETAFHEEPYPTGYEDIWCVSGWFQTPWGTASEGFRQISAKFPNCAFMFDSDEEAGFFCGIEIMHDGEIPYEEFFAPCDYDKEVDWDDDESIDEHNAWKETLSDKINDNATAWLMDNGFMQPKVVPVKTFTKTEKNEKKKSHFWKFA